MAEMNRDELDKRNTAAITHWWVTMRDTGKVAPGLLDDLASIADEHAEDFARDVDRMERIIDQHEAATTLRDDYDSSDAPPLVAASPESTGTPPTPSSAARTRTRTRTRGGAT